MVPKATSTFATRTLSALVDGQWHVSTLLSIWKGSILFGEGLCHHTNFSPNFEFKQGVKFELPGYNRIASVCPLRRTLSPATTFVSLPTDIHSFLANATLTLHVNVEAASSLQNHSSSKLSRNRVPEELSELPQEVGLGVDGISRSRDMRVSESHISMIVQLHDLK